MKELRQNKAFRTLCWQVFNAGVAFLISSLGGLE
nr:MAG TPA: Mitochondrial import receptor subunit Tom6, fungal [Caudoviricetes sp.]